MIILNTPPPFFILREPVAPPTTTSCGMTTASRPMSSSSSPTSCATPMCAARAQSPSRRLPTTPGWWLFALATTWWTKTTTGETVSLLERKSVQLWWVQWDEIRGISFSSSDPFVSASFLPAPRAATCLVRATAATRRLWRRRFRSTTTRSTPCTSPEDRPSSDTRLFLVCLCRLSVRSRFGSFTKAARRGRGAGWRVTERSPTSVPNSSRLFSTSNPALRVLPRQGGGAPMHKRKNKNKPLPQTPPQTHSWAIVLSLFLFFPPWMSALARLSDSRSAGPEVLPAKQDSYLLYLKAPPPPGGQICHKVLGLGGGEGRRPFQNDILWLLYIFSFLWASVWTPFWSFTSEVTTPIAIFLLSQRGGLYACASVCVCTWVCVCVRVMAGHWTVKGNQGADCCKCLRWVVLYSHIQEKKHIFTPVEQCGEGTAPPVGWWRHVDGPDSCVWLKCLQWVWTWGSIWSSRWSQVLTCSSEDRARVPSHFGPVGRFGPRVILGPWVVSDPGSLWTRRSFRPILKQDLSAESHCRTVLLLSCFYFFCSLHWPGRLATNRGHCRSLVPLCIYTFNKADL